MGFVTYKVNKGKLKDLHTQRKSMWLKLKLQKAEQKHEWVHEVIRCWHDIWWRDFKCLLCAECKIWNNKSKDVVSYSSIFEGKSVIDLSWARKTPCKYFCKYSTKHRDYIFWDLSQYIWTSCFSFLMTMLQNSCSSSLYHAHHTFLGKKKESKFCRNFGNILSNQLLNQSGSILQKIKLTLNLSMQNAKSCSVSFVGDLPTESKYSHNCAKKFQTQPSASL